MSGIKIVCDNQEEFDRLKAKATKLRVILLERKNKALFCHLSTFNTRDKQKFIKELNNLWSEMTDDEIDQEFNSIVSDKLLEGGTDVTSYPVKEMTYPDHSILYNPNDTISFGESKSNE